MVNDMEHNITISYDGSYPNLCSGTLIVYIDNKEWRFPSYCLESGGGVWFDDNKDEHVEHGRWTVSDWPDDFPDEYKKAVTNEINCNIKHGCCGGCI